MDRVRTDRVRTERVPRSGEAVMAGVFAAALTAATTIVSLVLLIVGGATFAVGYLTSLGDRPGTTSFPGLSFWLNLVAITGAVHCLLLWAVLHALHVDLPAAVAVLSTVGLCLAVVVWWNLGPGADPDRLGVMSSLFLLPPVSFVISSLATLTTSRRAPRPHPAPASR